MRIEGNEVAATGRVSREMPGSDSRIEVGGAFRMTFRDDRIVRVQQLGTGTNFDSALQADELSG